MTYLNELVSSRELLANLTAREVKGKYRRTVFGQLWSLINPLATMLIYTIVYSFIFRARLEEGDPSGLEIYPLWLMCGLLPWIFTRNVINSGMTSIVSNGSLIKKVYFPRMTLPLAAVGSFGFTWLVEMGVLLIALAFAGSKFWLFLPLIALTMLFLAMFAAGVGLILSIVNVHFRDMQHLVGIGLQMWMYLSPIIYPLSLVQDAAEKAGHPWIVHVYKLNPIERFSEVFRNLMYDNRLPNWTDLVACALAGCVSLALGYVVFSRNEKKLAELLLTDAAVSVENVSKRFRMYHERNDSLKSMVMRGKKSVHEDFWALKNVSFDVPQGTTFGLIGKNGSGKSTLLKCLAKILWPEQGSITARGKQASLLEVGSGFHPELSGRENVFLNGSILGMSRKEVARKFDEIVSFAGVGHFIDQPVKNYSSGMYVRLGFAVAVAVTPDILVVDEVLAVGDATFQNRCRRKFAEMKKEGRTVILVSHSMSTVRDMCDEVAWLDAGEVQRVGKADEVIKAYTATVE